jgi:integrase
MSGECLGWSCPVRGAYSLEWTPRELRHSFVSLMSANGASIELIARLVGHTTRATTEAVYRHELRPVITEGAEIIGKAFGSKSA